MGEFLDFEQTFELHANDLLFVMAVGRTFREIITINESKLPKININREYRGGSGSDTEILRDDSVKNYVHSLIRAKVFERIFRILGHDGKTQECEQEVATIRQKFVTEPCQGYTYEYQRNAEEKATIKRKLIEYDETMNAAIDNHLDAQMKPRETGFATGLPRKGAVALAAGGSATSATSAKSR